ncbi:MAG: SHOCT domain-containing protein [Acidimicrobiia bacterium]
MTTHLVLRLWGGLRLWEHGLGLRWIAFFLFLAFVALVLVGLAILLWRGNGPWGGSRPGLDDALSTLRMRYANGEMTREEFLQANQDLGGPQPPPPPPPSE